MVVHRMWWVMFGAGGLVGVASMVAAVVISINLIWSSFAPSPNTRQPYQPPKEATLPVGSPAPDFTARDLHGATVRLNDYRGKIVLLQVWSVTCGDCTVTMPHDEEIYQQLSDDIALLTVAVQSSEQSAREYAKQSKITYPVLLDTDDRFMTLYNVQMTPTIYLIDPQGIIRSVFPILASIEDVNAYIETCGKTCRPAQQ